MRGEWLALGGVGLLVGLGAFLAPMSINGRESLIDDILEAAGLSPGRARRRMRLRLESKSLPVLEEVLFNMMELGVEVA